MLGCCCLFCSLRIFSLPTEISRQGNRQRLRQFLSLSMMLAGKNYCAPSPTLHSMAARFALVLGSHTLLIPRPSNIRRAAVFIMRPQNPSKTLLNLHSPDVTRHGSSAPNVPHHIFTPANLPFYQALSDPSGPASLEVSLSRMAGARKQARARSSKSPGTCLANPGANPDGRLARGPGHLLPSSSSKRPVPILFHGELVVFMTPPVRWVSMPLTVSTLDDRALYGAESLCFRSAVSLTLWPRPTQGVGALFF